jgi:hypothetical protein
MKVAIVGLGMAGSTLACLPAYRDVVISSPDLLAPHVMKVRGVSAQAVTTLLGDRTSPWSAWVLPELA